MDGQYLQADAIDLGIVVASFQVHSATHVASVSRGSMANLDSCIEENLVLGAYACD